MADSTQAVAMEEKVIPIASTSSGSRKRRLSQNDTVGAPKRVHVKYVNDADTFSLLDFSDEMLLEILLNCNSVTLHALAKTCRRFANLVQDRRLWKTFDFAKKKMLGKEIKHLLKYVTKETIEFKVRGMVSKHPADKHKNNTLTATILSQLKAKCPELETIEVYEGFLNFEQIQISQFPAKLKRLMFHGCLIKQPRSPKVFNRIDQHLELLEELSLEKCNWFETHDLVVLSKLPHLKRLTLRGCASLRDCVPYGSIAARFGFKKLTMLDIRDTEVSDSDIQCFNITTSLREILMECPPRFRGNAPNENPSEIITDNEPEAGPSKNITDKSIDSIDSSPDSDVDTSSDMDTDDDSEELELSEEITRPKEENANGNGSAATPRNLGHFIQVIIRDGNVVDLANGHISSDQEHRSRASGLRYMVGVVNGEGPADVLQRHVEDHDRQDGFAQAGGILRGINHGHRGRPETREMETQTSKSDTAVSTRPNETQTDPCTKSSNETTPDADSNQPSTSKCLSNEIGLAGPSNRDAANSPNEVEETRDATESAEEVAASSPEASNRDEPAAADAVEPQPDNVVEPPNRDAEGNVRRAQRLIIIHQRRPEEDANGGNQNRRISWEINPRSNSLSYLRQFNRQQLGYTSQLTHLQLISDRGLCSFGNPRNNVQEGIVWIRAEMRPADTLLERITVRYYRSITDVSLRHLASCAPNLRYLDVTGTSVTANGVAQFIAAKPQCEVIWNGSSN